MLAKRTVRLPVVGCVALLTFLGLACASAFASFILRNQIPSLLTIQGPSSGWKSLSVDEAQTVGPRRIARVSPIAYGPHVVHVVLSNGKPLWLTFFHSDIGVERQLSIVADNASIKGDVRIRYATVRFEGLFLMKTARTVFSATVNPSDTSQAKPVVLDWI